MSERLAVRLGDLVAVAALLVLASPGWAEVYGGRRWMVTVAGALVLGLVIAWLGARLRWPAVVLAAVVVLMFVVLGAPLALPATPLPTVAALQTLLTGAVDGWWDVLTLAPPVGARGHLLVPALIASLVAAVLAGTFALRLQRSWPALVPPSALLVGVGLLGTSRAVLPAVQGVLLLVVSLAWVAWRQRRAVAGTGGSASADASARRTRAVLGSTAVLAVAAAAGTIAPATAAPERDRFSLREIIRPPLDPRAYASPLIAFRKYVKMPDDTPLFTVAGLPDGARIRLATLDTYDGVVWQVAPPNSGSGTGNFLAVGESTGDQSDGERAQVEITVEGYSGVWVPTVGQSTRIDFAGPNATALTEALGYNAASGTALTTRPLGQGDRYVLDAVIPPQPSDAVIGNTSPAPVTLPDPLQVPPAVVQVAGDMVAGATTPVSRARALEDDLGQGFFSHGLEGQPTSRAGHGADRIAALLAAEQMIGDDEQYAATMALMARSLGLPARVVMGFVPEEPGTVTGDDVAAWVEVAFAGHGWVTFDPTPDESRVPQQEAPKPRSEPRPQVQQPPPPVQEPDEPPPASEEDRDARDAAEGSGLGILLAALGYAGVPLLVLLAPCVVLLWLKARRRRHRARTGPPSARIAGGWSELVDSARDLGVRPPPRGTRRETARVLDEVYAGSGAIALAERADAGVFAPGEPTDDEVARFWVEVEESLRGMSGSVSRWRRIRARLSLASLRAGR